MSFKTFVLAGVSAASLATISVPALAIPGGITGNAWYTGAFGTGILAQVGGSLGAGTGIATGTHGPILPTGFQAEATNLTSSSWTITAPNGGYLTITDVEASGDQFKLSDNGTLMTPATGAFGGQAGLTGGLTSAPTLGDSSCIENINCALGDANYSSGTFALVDGENDITGVLAALTANSSPGAFDLIFELNAPPPTGAPEPATLAVVGAGLVGLSAARGWRKKSI